MYNVGVEKTQQNKQKGGDAVDYSKLRGSIREVFGTQAAFAKSMGFSACVLSQKLNGRSEWSAAEIRKAAELLHISTPELPLYFFCPKS